jgi:phospholipid/cholesterol/gamma-HCH transport system substrate-binding protein
LTGLAFIQLDDTAEGSPLLVSDAGKPARIPMRPGLVSRLTEQGGALLGNLEQGSQRLNQLLAQENQKTMMTAVQNLGQAAASLQQLTQRADKILIGQAGEGAPSLPQMTAQADATLRGIQAASEKLGASAEAVRNSANEFRRVSSRMTDPGGTLDRIARSTDAVATASQNWSAGVVPRLNRASDETARAARQTGRLAETLNDNPQALLMGKGTVAPGPGEPGFVSPPAK